MGIRSGSYQYSVPGAGAGGKRVLSRIIKCHQSIGEMQSSFSPQRDEDRARHVQRSWTRKIQSGSGGGGGVVMEAYRARCGVSPSTNGHQVSPGIPAVSIIGTGQASSVDNRPYHHRGVENNRAPLDGLPPSCWVAAFRLKRRDNKSPCRAQKDE